MNNECGYLEGYFVEEIQGTNDFNKLNNIPTINDVPIKGDLTLNDLGIQPKGDYALKDDIVGYDDTEIKQDIKKLQDDKADRTEIPNVNEFITKDVNNLTNYVLKDNTGTNIHLAIDNNTYVMTFSLKNENGNAISTEEVDLPLESMVIDADYDKTTKEIVLTLQNGNTTRVDVSAIISGLAKESDIPTKISQLQNDAGYITEYTETDPTVPSYVKNISKEDIKRWNNSQSNIPIYDSENVIIGYFNDKKSRVVDDVSEFIIDNIKDKNIVLTIGSVLFYIPQNANAINPDEEMQTLYFVSEPITNITYSKNSDIGTSAIIIRKELEIYLEYGEYADAILSGSSSYVSDGVSFLQTTGTLATNYNPTSIHQPANVKYVNDYVDEQVGNINSVLETLTTPTSTMSTFDLPKSSCKVTGTETYIEPIINEEVIEDGNN